MTLVGIEVLGGEIREYLRLAQKGEKVVVTEKGRPIAILAGIDERRESPQLWDLVDSGQASWKGGKPKGSANPVKVRGQSVSSMALEDRR